MLSTSTPPFSYRQPPFSELDDEVGQAWRQVHLDKSDHYCSQMGRTLGSQSLISLGSTHAFSIPFEADSGASDTIFHRIINANSPTMTTFQSSLALVAWI